MTLSWNLYGAGLDNMGKDHAPETFSIPQPDDDQLLVRVDSVSLCFSDVKIIQQGSNHPKLYHRDMQKEPTRLGHETAVTVIKVGKNLANTYHAGQRLAMQPDIFQNGKSTAYGYTIPGGLIQYHLIGKEVLVTDTGACLLPVEDGMSYVSASLLEPWGCVFASYTQRRRLEPKEGGIMWIIGRSDDTTNYTFSRGLDKPETIVLTDAPASIKNLLKNSQARIVEHNGIGPDQYASLAEELTGAKGFDDIIVLDPRSAETVSAIAKYISRRGTLNLVGKVALDGRVPADVGRLHYDYIAFLGNQGPEISASYGEARNRCELQKGGVALFLGAGGPMGQMHVQRALEMADGPAVVIATEMNQSRLDILHQHLDPVAEKNQRKFILFDASRPNQELRQLVMDLTGGKGADDVVLSVPSPALASEAATLMNENGMLVLFAGMPNGSLAPLDFSSVYLHNAQYTGTSGLTIQDQALVMRKAVSGDLSPDMSLAAVGGMKTAQAGYEALIAGRYPGKIAIFPQLVDMPLMGLDELKQKYPAIGDKLGAGNAWTMEAEKQLIETFWSAQEA
ncbi:MAG: alcohol dehydrogenase catalytic domain-containing protein [Anaerolineae bacterium]|nr:alcohol dehydrogenase catalytic domain-containing protein [Anaerolineae bacterium]